MTYRYPLARVSYGASEIAAVTRALESGQTTCGPRVAEFETLFAEYVGRDHAVMVNSGSSADLLVAFGLGHAQGDDEVLIPAVTWPTQVWSCLLAGYKVRLVDVDPNTLQFDMGDLVRKAGSHTRAVFPVHVLGNVGDMDALIRMAEPQGITVLEDCCEALGSRWRGVHVGTFGQAAAFSFFFSHLITTMEGGMVVCDADAEHQYRLWRSHGWEPKKDYRFWFTSMGFNLRPTELQGAFGCVQMVYLESFQQARDRNAQRLFRMTSGMHPDCLRHIRVLPQCEPSWHGFALMVSPAAPFSRDMLCRYLDEHGVENRPIIAGNLARQPAIMADSRVICGALPGADAVHDFGFYIGLASVDDEVGTDYVGEVIAGFIEANT